MTATGVQELWVNEKYCRDRIWIACVHLACGYAKDGQLLLFKAKMTKCGRKIADSGQGIDFL